MTKNDAGFRTRFRKYCRIAARWLGSNTFFGVVLGIFIAQALWIAWSGAYSMAYDEFFHLGIIQEYAKGWTPFIHQPAGPAVLGALERDPSFLYHYLMSFPYRIITEVWHSFAAQIIALRILNIGIFVWGLVLYCKLLLRAGLSRKSTHTVLLFFTLVPTVLMVALQVNYDAMMFLASGAALLLAVSATLTLRHDHKIQPVQLLALIAVLMAGSIVKYAFLPLAAAIGVFMVTQLLLAFRRRQISWQGIMQECRAAIRRSTTWLIVVAFVVVGILFAQRIGGNIIRYHTPAPDCSVVLSLEECKVHAPYGRNQKYKENNLATAITTTDRLSYPVTWYKKMLQESFFAIGPEQLSYPYGKPLPTAYAAGIIIVPVMLTIILISIVRLWRNPIWQLFIVSVATYTSALFFRNYSEYIELGVPVAIHGRYIIYLMPLVAALAVASAQTYLRGRGRQIVYATTAVLLTLMVLGGGWLPYMIRSADNWLWPHAAPVNRTIRSVLWQIIPK